MSLFFKTPVSVFQSFKSCPAELSDFMVLVAPGHGIFDES